MTELLQWSDAPMGRRKSRKITARAGIGNYVVERTQYTHRPSFSCRFKGLVFDYALSFGDGMRMCQRHYAEKVSYRHAMSAGDEMRHPITVEVADASYHLAAYSYDATPHPTRIQELKLLRARAALRLACNVHVSGQTEGEK